MVGFPWDFSETPVSCRRSAPEYGEHTVEVLQELGYGDESIEAFKKKEIVA
jgi:formyl-CoA transferase